MRKSLSFYSCLATFGLLLAPSCVSWEVPDVDGDGILAVDGDCNDLNAGSFPGAPEVWYDGEDQDCDGNDGDHQQGFNQSESGFFGETFHKPFRNVVSSTQRGFLITRIHCLLEFIVYSNSLSTRIHCPVVPRGN